MFGSLSKTVFIINIVWSFCLFRMVLALLEEWRSCRQTRGQTSDLINLPMVNVLEWTPEELNQWIPLFLYEMRKRDGTDYRAKTVMEYLLALQSAFSHLRGKKFSFLKDDLFNPIRNALDNRMRSLQAQGLGYNPSQAEIISREMEEALWMGGQLGADPPSRLLNTMVYLLGINLGLRAGEHRLLRRNMFKVNIISVICRILEWKHSAF